MTLARPSVNVAAMSIRLPGFASLSAALTVLLVAGLAQAETRVYRCEDAGRVTYADFPCANARAVAVDGGAAAPDARERLRRNQDELDQRAAARRDALAREAAMARLQSPSPPIDVAPPVSSGYDPVYDFAYPPLGVRGDHVAHRDDDRTREKRRRSVITQPPPTRLRAGQH